MSIVINKITILFAAMLLQTTTSIARTPADSLKSMLAHKNLTREQEILILGQLAKATSINATSHALHLAQQAVQLSRSLADAQYTAITYATMAQIYMQADDISKSAQAIDSALFYANKTESPLAKGVAWYRKSWMENIKSQYPESLSSAQKAVQYLEKAKATSYLSAVYYIIAGIYANQYDGPLHKKYALLCLHTALQDKDYDNLFCAWQSLGTYWHYYYMQHQNERTSLDSALFYNQLASNTFPAVKDKMIFHSTMAIIALNTADIYAQYFPAATYRDTVFRYLNLAEKIGTETHHIEVIANCYGMKSDYEAAAGNYDNAEALLLKGLEIVKTDSAKNLATKIQFMASLSTLAEKRGHFKEALHYQQQYSNLYADLYNEEKLNMTKELEAKYQAEKNATALRTAQQTTTLHKRLGYLYIGITLASVTAAVFLLRSSRLRLKLVEKAKDDATLQALLKQQENKQLALEKQEAELQARLKNEETLRLSAEQQLLQERQERLQKDLLAETLQVEQKTALLQTLQKTIAESRDDKAVLTQINRIIIHDKKLDESIAGSKADFDNINPDFFKKLEEQSSDSLSRLDMKHCSYIYLGLSNKEVSQRLGIAHKSILMARYRIKQKLGLGKEEELDKYIRSL